MTDDVQAFATHTQDFIASIPNREGVFFVFAGTNYQAGGDPGLGQPVSFTLAPQPDRVTVSVQADALEYDGRWYVVVMTLYQGHVRARRLVAFGSEDEARGAMQALAQQEADDIRQWAESE